MDLLAESSADSIAQAAAAWVVRHDRGLSASEAAAFQIWLKEPTHKEEFARITSGWEKLGRVGEMRALTLESDAIVRRARRRQSRRRVMWLASSALATAAGFAFLLLRSPAPVVPATEHYQILASTSHDERLSDGSVVTLNGDSRIETAFTSTERHVRLIQGEALFAVAKNPNCPFFVTAGPITVRAVGTAFNVRLGAAAVEVLVTEGKVRVDDSAKGGSLLPPIQPLAREPAPHREEGVLSAGQRVVVNLDSVVNPTTVAQVAAVAHSEIEQLLAWRSTRLVFNDTPLDEVVAAFNRYNEKKMSLGDSTLKGRKITGVFRSDNLGAFTRLIEGGIDVRAESRGANEIVLLPAR